MEVCEIATKAINILETEGWTQGDYYHKGQGYCLMGVICKASGYVDYAIDYSANTGEGLINYRNIRNELVTNNPQFQEIGMTTWNDQEERTKEEVIAVLQALCD